MSIAERFPHMNASQIARYEAALAASPPVPCDKTPTIDQPATREMRSHNPCKFRGAIMGEAKTRACCGQKKTATTHACERLRTRCVVLGTPVDESVAVCLLCDKYEAVSK